MFDIAARQGIPKRARVIHHVHVRELRGLITHAVEQSKQALQVPPGAEMARNDQCARHEAAVYPSVRFDAGAENSEPSGSVAEIDGSMPNAFLETPRESRKVAPFRLAFGLRYLVGISSPQHETRPPMWRLP